MDDDVQKVNDILSSMHIAMLTTLAQDGTLIARPMALQEVEFDGDLWFFAERSSAAVAHVTERPHVNVSATSNAAWISVHGEAAVVEDQAKKDELWSSVVEAWFPDGPTADVVLLKVTALGAEYWESAGGRIATALSFAKAKLTGTRYEGGENEVVSLD